MNSEPLKSCSLATLQQNRARKMYVQAGARKILGGGGLQFLLDELTSLITFDVLKLGGETSSLVWLRHCVLAPYF